MIFVEYCREWTPPSSCDPDADWSCFPACALPSLTESYPCSSLKIPSSSGQPAPACDAQSRMVPLDDGVGEIYSRQQAASARDWTEDEETLRLAYQETSRMPLAEHRTRPPFAQPSSPHHQHSTEHFQPLAAAEPSLPTQQTHPSGGAGKIDSSASPARALHYQIARKWVLGTGTCPQRLNYLTRS